MLRCLSPASTQGSRGRFCCGSASWNPPLQHMPFRAVQIVPEALEIAKQLLLAKGDEPQLADDAFLDFEHVRAFLKLAAAGAAFDFVGLHCQGKMR